MCMAFLLYLPRQNNIQAVTCSENEQFESILPFCFASHTSQALESIGQLGWTFGSFLSIDANNGSKWMWPILIDWLIDCNDPIFILVDAINGNHSLSFFLLTTAGVLLLVFFLMMLLCMSSIDDITTNKNEPSNTNDDIRHDNSKCPCQQHCCWCWNSNNNNNNKQHFVTLQCSSSWWYKDSWSWFQDICTCVSVYMMYNRLYSKYSTFYNNHLM